MEKIEEIVNEICKKNNYDEMLLEIVKKGKETNIKIILEEISKNSKLTEQEKKEIYEKLFDYVKEVNESLENKMKDIYIKGINNGIESILLLSNESINTIKTEKEILEKYKDYYEKIKKEEKNMNDKMKIIIADDNVHICEFTKKFLEKYEDVEIIGVANTDEEEVRMIEELKPEIVITDLMRNHKYTGLDIIKNYQNKKDAPQFLVVSADEERNVIRDGIKIAGYIKKPFSDYEILIKELRRIKSKTKKFDYDEWYEEYHNKEIFDIKKYLDKKDMKIIQKLGIKTYDKIYTEYELEVLEMDLLAYYEDLEEELSEEELQYQKPLKGTGVTRKKYNNLLNKIQEIKNHK